MPGRVKDSTLTGYRWMIRKHVIPRIGSVPLGKLTPGHVETMLRQMEVQGLSAASRRQARVILGRALSTAERSGDVGRNVARLTEAPRSDRVRVGDSLSAEEARAVLSAASGERNELLAHLVLRLGLRQGEALALRWADVSIDLPGNSELSIEHSLKRRPKSEGGGWYLDTLKSSASRRVLPLGDSLAVRFRSHRRAQLEERIQLGPVREDHDFVFCSAVGTPLEARNVLRWWHSLTERAGVGRRRFHASRHTAATLLLDAGEPLERVSALLGHSSYAVTADVYASVTARARREALSSLDAVLGT